MALYALLIAEMHAMAVHQMFKWLTVARITFMDYLPYFHAIFAIVLSRETPHVIWIFLKRLILFSFELIFEMNVDSYLYVFN